MKNSPPLRRICARRPIRRIRLTRGPRLLCGGVSRLDGRCPARDGGKSGLHGETAPDNVRRGRPQGKRHRKQTAFGSPKVRVKGSGKSAPRGRRRKRHGKPRREQNRIGTTGFYPASPGRRPGWLHETAGNGRPRGLAIARHFFRSLRHTPTARGGMAPYRTRLTGRLALFGEKSRAKPRSVNNVLTLTML